MSKISKNLKKTQKNTLDIYVKKQINNAYLNLHADNEPQVDDLSRAVSTINEPVKLMLLDEPSSKPPIKLQPQLQPVNKTVVLTENGANLQVNDPRISENTTIDSAKVAMLEEKCAALETQNKQLMKDNKALKKLLSESKSINLYKDIQLKNLKKNDRSNEVKPLLFAKYKDKFTEEQLFELRSVSKGKSKDSEFMTLLVDFLYGKNVDKMCIRQKKGSTKTEIDNDTMAMIGKMLEERVNTEGIPQQEVVMRCGSLNRIIGNGIYNNNRKKRSTQTNAPQQPRETVAANNELNSGMNYNSTYIQPTYNQNSYYTPYQYPPFAYPYPYGQGYYFPPQ